MAGARGEDVEGCAPRGEAPKEDIDSSEGAGDGNSGGRLGADSECEYACAGCPATATGRRGRPDGKAAGGGDGAAIAGAAAALLSEGTGGDDGEGIGSDTAVGLTTAGGGPSGITGITTGATSLSLREAGATGTPPLVMAGLLAALTRPTSEAGTAACARAAG